MIRIYEYIITISGTVKVIAETFDEIRIKQIIENIDENNIIIENVNKIKITGE